MTDFKMNESRVAICPQRTLRTANTLLYNAEFSDGEDEEQTGYTQEEITQIIAWFDANSITWIK